MLIDILDFVFDFYFTLFYFISFQILDKKMYHKIGFLELLCISVILVIDDS